MRLQTSAAAELQSLQTRAKISAALTYQIVNGLFLLWLALTLWLVWHRVGQEHPELHHAYFGRWIVSDLFADTPLLSRFAEPLPMYAAGNWYTLPSFAAWLDNAYGGSIYSWGWRAATGAGYYGLGSALLPLVLGAVLLVWWWRRDPEGNNHLRGLRLINPRTLNRQIHDGAFKRWLHGPPQGLELGGVIIPKRQLSEHLMITGNPGSGKSTAIRSLLRQISRDKSVAIVIDPEGEYTQEFYSEERGDWILNPLDGRCPFWSPWLELREEWFAVDAAAIAASLVRGKPRDANQAFFLESTRTVIESIFQVARTGNHGADLLSFIGLPRAELHQALAGTPAYPLIDPKATEQGSGILGTAVNAIKTFVHLPRREDAERTWSARQWAQDRHGWVFLPSRDDLRDAIHVLQGLWLDCLVRWLMSAEIGSGQVFLMLDEVASLGHQAQLEKLLTRGRKRGIAVTLGLQSISQLKTIYGPEGAVTLTASPSTKLIMRVDETEMANAASELIGRHEVERLVMTQLAGLSTYREGVNLSPHRNIDTLVLPDEIKLLKPFTGYLCIAGFDRTMIAIAHQHLVRNEPAFVSRVEQLRAAPKPVVPLEPEALQAEAILAQLAAR